MMRTTPFSTIGQVANAGFSRANQALARCAKV